MPRDDRFKKAQEVGNDFLEAARARAEEFLQELAKLGDSTQKQAQGTVEDLMAGSRKGTEQVVETIRKEITTQLSALGLATKADLAALERRVTGGAGGAKKAAATKAAPAKKTAAKKAPAKKAPAKKAAAKKAAGGA
jgi:polyhydroxyalkanoate synthesis regulator phasin